MFSGINVVSDFLSQTIRDIELVKCFQSGKLLLISVCVHWVQHNADPLRAWLSSGRNNTYKLSEDSLHPANISCDILADSVDQTTGLERESSL